MVIPDTESLDSFEITGRGTVYVVPWFEMTEDEWFDLPMGKKEITINGDRFQILGVERWAIAESRSYAAHKDRSICVLVKPL